MAGTLSATVALGTTSNAPFSGNSALAAQTLESYARALGLTGAGSLDVASALVKFSSVAALFGSGTYGLATKQVYTNIPAALTSLGAMSAQAKASYSKIAPFGSTGQLQCDVAQVQLQVISSAFVIDSAMAIPTHAPGDLILVLGVGSAGASMSAAAVGGTVPQWNSIDMGTSNPGSLLAWALATRNDHTTGNWTNTTPSTMAAIVIRNQAGSPIGGHGKLFVNGVTATAPSALMSKSDGSSMLLHFFSARMSASNQWPAAPAGYTQQLINPTLPTSPASKIMINTKDDSLAAGYSSVATQSTGESSSVNTQGFTVEILQTGVTALNEENVPRTNSLVPAGVSGCWVTLIGAGGGGGNGFAQVFSNAGGGAGGGGAAKVDRSFIPVANLGSTYSISAPSGQTGVATDGGDAVFSSGSTVLTAGGGGRGANGTNSGSRPGGTAGIATASGVAATLINGTAGGAGGNANNTVGAQGVDNTDGGGAGGGGGGGRSSSGSTSDGNRGGNSTMAFGGVKAGVGVPSGNGGSAGINQPGAGGGAGYGNNGSVNAGGGDGGTAGGGGGGGGGGNKAGDIPGGKGAPGYSLIEWV